MIKETIINSRLYQWITWFYAVLDRMVGRLLSSSYIQLLIRLLDRLMAFFNGIDSRIYYLLLFFYSILYTVLSYPLIHFQSHTYDYVFHMTRMVGLAESLQHWDFLPNLNFMYAYGTGYASPMFYGNWQFYPSALLYLLTDDALLAYSFFAFLLVFAGMAASFLCIYKISQNKSTALLVALTVPSFYSLFGFGMTMVVPLVPLLIYAIYRVLILNKRNPLYLGLVIALLLQTHLISTLVLAIYSLVFVLLNLKRLNKAKLLSFTMSVVMAFFLSAGFIFQYLEQTASQTFFFSWQGRSYPVDVAETFAVPFPFQADSYGLYKPFTSLEWPIHQLIIYGFLAFGLLALLFYKRLNVWAKTFYWSIWIIYFASTNILPWRDSLKFTFLGSLQYTGRLLFFLPLIFLFLLALTSKRGILSLVLCLASLSFFYGRLLPRYSKPSENYRRLVEYSKEHTERLADVYKGDKSLLLSPVGDEYYNLEIRNDDVRDPQFGDFGVSDGLEVSNVKRSYNRLDFDVSFSDFAQEGRVILPRIWYKGYQVSYSQGAAGSLARMASIPYTKAERTVNQEKKKPELTDKVLNNGKITLEISQPGHVSLSYHKTLIQYLGYILELLSWTLVAYILYVVFQKKRRKARQAAA